MLGGADNPNGELLSYIIGADTIQTKHRIVTQMTINIIKNVRCGIIAPPLPYGGYRATIMLSRHYSRALG